MDTGEVKDDKATADAHANPLNGPKKEETDQVSTAASTSTSHTDTTTSDDEDFNELEEQSSSNIEYLLSKMKDPVDARPVDESTLHGKNIIAKRLQNRQQREARTAIFDSFSLPTDHLTQWPRCPAMSSQDLERQKYVAVLASIMTDAKKLNGVMADAKIRQIGKTKII